MHCRPAPCWPTRILVLDEPTAHPDAKTAHAVLDDLLAATSGRSVILVTDDLAGLDRADELVVLRGGRTEQRGAGLRGRPGRNAQAATHSDR